MPRSSRPLDIYVRTSARGSRTDETLQTLDQQVRDCRAYAEREGLPLSGVVLEDRFRSGALKRARRKGLSEALERIKAGESGGIVVAYLSRATREGGTGLQLFEEIDRAGGAIYGPNVPTDWRSADGRLVLGLQLIIDAHVVDKAREHTWKAKAHSIERGIAVAGTPPVGYARGADRRYVPSHAAEVVRRAFQMRASGTGIADITDYLNSSGVRTSRGNAWSTVTVRGMLANRAYLGEARCGPYVNAMAHEPLVEADTFHAAQAATRGRRRPRRDAHRVYLLLGVVRCASCGYSLRGTEDSRGTPMYRCAVRHGGGVCPNPARCRALELEDQVVARYLADGRVLSLNVPSDDALRPLEHARAVAWRRLAQVLSPDARDALGSLWAADVKARREEYEAAAAELGKAQAPRGRDVERLVDLKRHWRDADLGELGTASGPAYFLSDELKRELLKQRFTAIAVRQTGRGRWEWYEADDEDLPYPGERKPRLRELRPR